MGNDELKQYKHQWYMKHREDCLKRSLQWHIEHPEIVKQTLQRYRVRNQAEFNRRQREYYQRNKDRLRQENLVRMEANREKYSARWKAKRAVLEPECELCGTVDNLEHHHPDYSEPLVTVTVCKLCHECIHAGLQGSNMNRATITSEASA